MATEGSRLFLNAFIEIEQALRRIVGTNRHRPFYHLVNDAAKGDAFVRDIAVELKELGDLRNAIVHERIDDQPIAEPHEKTVQRIEQIRDMLLRPPLVKDEFVCPVVVARPMDSLAKVARIMHERGLSKIPIYNGKQFLGLLTAEAMVQWQGSQQGNDHKGSTCPAWTDQPVQDVLGYANRQETCRFVGGDDTLFIVLDLFEEFIHSGNKLLAVLVTQSGREDQDLMGIITIYDLPKIYDLLGL